MCGERAQPSGLTPPTGGFLSYVYDIDTLPCCSVLIRLNVVDGTVHILNVVMMFENSINKQ